MIGRKERKRKGSDLSPGVLVQTADILTNTGSPKRPNQSTDQKVALVKVPDADQGHTAKAGQTLVRHQGRMIDEDLGQGHMTDAVRDQDHMTGEGQEAEKDIPDDYQEVAVGVVDSQ